VTRPGPVVLRTGVEVDDPIGVALAFLDAYGVDAGDPSSSMTFGEPDLRRANGGGARISAVEIAAILERRRPIERALRAIPPDASLAEAANRVPWEALGQLFAAFANIRGVGLSKTTKSLHAKRPALIPMLDSVVQKHLASADPGREAPFAERALALVRGYRADLDRNRTALDAVRCELSGRGLPLTAVRILDLLIWSVESGAPG